MTLRRFLLLVAGALIAGVAVTAQPFDRLRTAPSTVEGQQPPRFRGGVDLIQIDVAVLDSHRRPVANLTAADFTILEDGKPQPIAAFEELSAPDPDGSLVPWMREITPDVRTNSADGRRVFVMVIDDASFGGAMDSLRVVDNVKKIARAFVDRLGPLDQVCIVQTGDNSRAQEFTDDRQALYRVIDKVHPIFVPPDLAMAYAPGTVRKAAEALMGISHRRKAMIYIGHGLRVSTDSVITPIGVGGGGAAAGASQAVYLAQQAIERAQRANVTIYTINPRGLDVDADLAAAQERTMAEDALYSVANETGGFAVTSTNSFTEQVGQIFRETGSYYLLGFHSAYTDGKFRRITVKVNRPGVSVRTRNGYYAPKNEKPEKAAEPIIKALSGVLPDPDMYMRAAVAPFAAAEKPGAKEKKNGAVTVVLGLSQPAARERTSQVIDLIATAFTTEGKPVGQRRQTAQLTLRASDAADAKFEVLSRLDLKPGRYNLRFALHNRALGKSGSVYSEVEVPNFAKDPLSLSGLIVSVANGLPAAGHDMLGAVVPQSPTTQRSFAADDRVTVFLRVYQGGGKPPMPVTLRTRITNAADEVVHQSTSAVDPSAESDASLPLPLTRLVPGPYLLTIDASSSSAVTARRDLRFSVR